MRFKKCFCLIIRSFFSSETERQSDHVYFSASMSWQLNNKNWYFYFRNLFIEMTLLFHLGDSRKYVLTRVSTSLKHFFYTVTETSWNKKFSRFDARWSLSSSLTFPPDSSMLSAREIFEAHSSVRCWHYRHSALSQVPTRQRLFSMINVNVEAGG